VLQDDFKPEAHCDNYLTDYGRSSIRAYLN
jgi:hypothetical protein